jgi:hypothetical protein
VAATTSCLRPVRGAQRLKRGVRRDAKIPARSFGQVLIQTRKVKQREGLSSPEGCTNNRGFRALACPSKGRAAQERIAKCLVTPLARLYNPCPTLPLLCPFRRRASGSSHARLPRYAGYQSRSAGAIFPLPETPTGQRTPKDNWERGRQAEGKAMGRRIACSGCHSR